MSFHRVCCCQTPASLWEIEPENAVQWGIHPGVVQRLSADVTQAVYVLVSGARRWTIGDVPIGTNTTSVGSIGGGVVDATYSEASSRGLLVTVESTVSTTNTGAKINEVPVASRAAGFVWESRAYSVVRLSGSPTTVRVGYRNTDQTFFLQYIATDCQMPPTTFYGGRMRPYNSNTAIVYGGWKADGYPSLVSVNFAATAVNWHADTGQHVWDVSADANRIAVGQDQTNGASVLVYDYSGNAIGSHDTGGNVRGVSVGPSGEIYATGTRNNGVSVWRFQPGASEPDWTYDTGADTTACLYKSGRLFVAGSVSSTWRYPAP